MKKQKKQAKRLELSKETVSMLNHGALKEAVGGEGASSQCSHTDYMTGCCCDWH